MTEYAPAWTHEDIKPSYPEAVRPRDAAPNVLIVLLDDTGFADLGCYGSEIATPRIDRIAAEGLQYTNFHTTTLCSPTRASLLTGRNHHSVGMRMLSNVDSGLPSGRGAIKPQAATLAEVLRLAGYNTFAVGKWHLAPMTDTGPAGPYDHWPLNKGFERFYGFMEGATDQFYPELTEDNHRIEPPATPEEGYHLTEDLVDQAIAMIADQASNAPHKPFLCYLALGATHAPHQAPASYLERYRGAYDHGYDEVRERRYRRQLRTGVIPEDTRLPPRNPGVPAWTDLSTSQRQVSARLQEAYAAFLTHTDDHVGRLLDALEEMAKLDNTLIILLSDNGAAMEGGPLGAVSRIRYFNGLAEDQEFNERHIDTIGTPQGDNHYPMGWAQASNTPGRWFKYHTHAGGVRDPLIIKWPAALKPVGEKRRQFHHVIDIVPTVLRAAGVGMPATINGVAQLDLHGVDMSYTFSGAGEPSRRRVQYFEMFGNRGLYADGWKAVTRHVPGTTYGEPWELYRVDEDFSESEDLALTHPEKLDELVSQWHVEAGKYDVLPLDDRSVELFAAPVPPNSHFARRQFVYYAGASHVHSRACPPLADRSWSVRATVTWATDDRGVIFVHGNAWSGHALYVQDQRLAYEYNCCGHVTRLVSSDELHPGVTQVRYDFARTGPLEGDGQLFVDEMPQGRARFDRTLSFISTTGMDIGKNAGPPFSRHYDPPFRYTGKLVSVRFDIGSDGDPSFLVHPSDLEEDGIGGTTSAGTSGT